MEIFIVHVHVQVHIYIAVFNNFFSLHFLSLLVQWKIVLHIIAIMEYESFECYYCADQIHHSYIFVYAKFTMYYCILLTLKLKCIWF